MPTMCQVTIRTTDGVAANFATNQFAMTGEVSSPTDADSVVAAIKGFYDDINGQLFPASIAQNNHIVKFYALPGLTPNYPFYESTFNLASAPAGTLLPSEVAVCLSFQGTRTAGQPQGRRRGRVYIGPCDQSAGTSGRPNATTITTLLDAAEGFYDAIDAIASAGSWAVWSPTDGDAVALVEAWVDDAWDTQRSRGVEVTTRTTRSLI